MRPARGACTRRVPAIRDNRHAMAGNFRDPVSYRRRSVPLAFGEAAEGHESDQRDDQADQKLQTIITRSRRSPGCRRGRFHPYCRPCVLLPSDAPRKRCHPASRTAASNPTSVSFSTSCERSSFSIVRQLTFSSGCGDPQTSARRARRAGRSRRTRSRAPAADRTAGRRGASRRGGGRRRGRGRPGRRRSSRGGAPPVGWGRARGAPARRPGRRRPRR